jgi:hypothetical protein
VGARGVARAFSAIPLTHSLYRDKRFVRQAWLQELLDQGMLDGRLRWKAPVGTEVAL